MNHEEKAVKFFEEYFCSQAVFAAFSPELGLSEEQALKIGACFGSGMRKGEVCGACTGALMVLGLKYGESKEKSNEACDEFMDAFKSENKSYICRDLIGCDISTPEGVEYARNNNLFKDICPKMVASAARIVGEMVSREDES